MFASIRTALDSKGQLKFIGTWKMTEAKPLPADGLICFDMLTWLARQQFHSPTRELIRAERHAPPPHPADPENDWVGLGPGRVGPQRTTGAAIRTTRSIERTGGSSETRITRGALALSGKSRL